MVEQRPVMGNLSVLLLDDNPTSLWMVSSVLVETGFKVFPFETVEAALDFVKSRPAIKEELDLVLAEVRFRNIAPGSSAHSELLHHILNELKVPLFTMCAYGDEDALSKHVALGACHHVLKPLHTGSLNMLKQKALEHKSKKATPQGPIPSRTKSGMASSSTKKLQKKLITERNILSNPGINESEVPEVGCSKKPGRAIWTLELHEKFLDALQVLGDKYATPEGILKLMNVKCFTSKQIGSHLQKHRLQQRKAKNGQKNVSMKPVSELIGSAHNAATTESITLRVDADIREVYPKRLWKQVKEAAASKTGTYSGTSGKYKCGTKSVWDEYEKGLQKEFSTSNRRWQQIGLSLSKRQLPVKHNVVAIDVGVSSEAPKAAGEIGYDAFVESSGSSSLSTSLVDLDGENTRTEAAGDNDNVGNTRTEAAGDNDNVGNTRTEAAGDNDNVGNINMFKDGGISSEAPRAAGEIGYGVSIESFEAAGNNDNVGNINMLEGTMNKEHTAAMDPDDVWGLPQSSELDLACPSHGMGEEEISNWMSELQGSQDQQNIGLEDMLQVDNARNTGLASTSLINMDGSMAQEASAHNAPVDNPMMPNAQDDGFFDDFDFDFDFDVDMV